MGVVTTMLSQHAMPADVRTKAVRGRGIAIEGDAASIIGAPAVAGLENPDAFVTPSAVVVA